MHGHVSTWDVTAVTDMSSLLGGSCRSTFNEDVNAWDVGQVTNMNVRRRALRQGHRAPARTQLWGPQAMCVCWRGAVYVLWSERFQPACGSLGCRPVDQHGGAPPPCVRVTGLLHTHVALGATSHVRVLARRSLCSMERALSTSLWKLGMSARSPTWGCAAALRQGHRAPAHTRRSGGHKPCACAGAAQSMFYGASAFNQPVEAWDVGQVTNMGVRRRPASGSQGSCTRTAAQRSGHKPCACAGAAQRMFHNRKGFQPARGSLGRRPGLDH